MAKYRTGPHAMPEAVAVRPTIRLDKWLWQARFYKTRGQATDEVAGGHVRVNGQRVTKPAHAVGSGDTLTLVLEARTRLIRILGPGLRRGPATEAQALYLDLDDPRPSGTDPAAASPLE